MSEILMYARDPDTLEDIKLATIDAPVGQPIPRVGERLRWTTSGKDEVPAGEYTFTIYDVLWLMDDQEFSGIKMVVTWEGRFPGT